MEPSDLNPPHPRPLDWLELCEALLERIKGRVSLLQPPHERFHAVAAALDDLCRHDTNGLSKLVDTEDRRHQFLDEFLSYDVIEEFLDDPVVEDIMINSTYPIFVHRTGHGLVKTERRFLTQRELALFVKKLIVFAGRTELAPTNDVELADIRGRANIVASPFGPQVTITRGKAQPLTILQLIDSGMLPDELAAQLWLYIEGMHVKPVNLIISGGPGTGKTTLMNALLSFIPSTDRVVTIEDTLELNTSFLENCSRLESSREADLPALVKNSLRMRPDRIIIGEVRGEEAHDMITAVNLGKYCLGTLHASSARETILRLQNKPMNVPPVLVNLVDVFVILRKLNLDGKMVRVVGELVETSGMEQQTVLLSVVWAYDYQRRRVMEVSPSSTYRDRLAAASGRSAVDIMQETAQRARVLRAMQASQRFPDIAAVTAFCQLYSRAPADALKHLQVNSEQ